MFNIIGADGKQYGPVAAEQIRQWVREGRANGTSRIQAVDGTIWQTLAMTPEFADLFNSPAPPPAMNPPRTDLAARASNKIPAGICGILLGGLGVHKFILGYTNTGVLMLVVSVVGTLIGFFTCITFFAATAMSIIGLIEGIIYLTKTDEEFVRLYVDGRKDWF